MSSFSGTLRGPAVNVLCWPQAHPCKKGDAGHTVNVLLLGKPLQACNNEDAYALL